MISLRPKTICYVDSPHLVANAYCAGSRCTAKWRFLLKNEYFLFALNVYIWTPMVWIVHQHIAAAIARCIGIFTEITGFFIHVPGLVNIHLVWPMSMVVEFYYSSPNSRHFFSQNDSGHVLLKQIMMTLRDVFTILPCYTYMLHMCDEDHTKHQCWRSSFAEAWLFKSFGWFKKPLAILQHDGWGRQEA